MKIDVTIKLKVTGGYALLRSKWEHTLIFTGKVSAPALPDAGHFLFMEIFDGMVSRGDIQWVTISWLEVKEVYHELKDGVLHPKISCVVDHPVHIRKVKTTGIRWMTEHLAPRLKELGFSQA